MRNTDSAVLSTDPSSTTMT